MSLTANQKRMVAVLGASLIGFAIDQVFLPAPAASDAQALLTPNAAAASARSSAIPGSPDAKAAAAPATRPSFRWGARHLGPRLLATTRPLTPEALAARDAFYSPVLAAQPTPSAQGPNPTATDRAEAPVDPAERFLRDHQLRAVISSGPASMALVDDLMVRPGQRVSGFRLLSVDKASALFEGPDAAGNNVRVRLVISDPPKIQPPG